MVSSDHQRVISRGSGSHSAIVGVRRAALRLVAGYQSGEGVAGVAGFVALRRRSFLSRRRRRRMSRRRLARGLSSRNVIHCPPRSTSVTIPSMLSAGTDMSGSGEASPQVWKRSCPPLRSVRTRRWYTGLPPGPTTSITSPTSTSSASAGATRTRQPSGIAGDMLAPVTRVVTAWPAPSKSAINAAYAFRLSVIAHLSARLPHQAWGRSRSRRWAHCARRRQVRRGS